MGRRHRAKERPFETEATGDAAPYLLAPVILSCAMLFAAMRSFWGFVQDDAYISLRYAWFFAHGEGLVFNPGERVEGFTNLSWTLLAAFFIRIGIDPLDGVRVVGALSALALVVLVWLEAGGDSWRISRRSAWAGGVAAMLIASFTTLAVWAVAGMEQSFFCLLVFSGYRMFARGQFTHAAALWVAATFTRPEGPLAFAIAAFLRGVDCVRLRRPPSRDEVRALAVFATGMFGLLFYRVAYFGELAPNTFFVKGVANLASHQHGLAEMRKFLEFNAIGVSLVMALVGLIGWAWMPPGTPAVTEDAPVRRPREEAAFGALYILGMSYYLIRVGGDLLPMYRLYMPLLPFFALWAGRSIEWLAALILVRIDDVGGKPDPKSAGVLIAIAATLGLAGAASYAFKTSLGHPEYKGTIIALDRCHGTAGRYLQAVAKERGKRITVLAQDMGMTPWVAPDVRFVDVIGLTDHTVAHTLYSYAYTPYIRYLVWNLPGWQQRITEMEAKLRDYLAKQDADFILVNISCEAPQTGPFRSALAKLDNAFFQPYVEQNTFYYGYPGTQEFKNKYRLTQGFEFSAVHFLLLYERAAGQ